MNEREIFFNVFVKKLDLRNDSVTSDQTIVKFEWGDDKDLNFYIDSNRINASDFDINTIIEFKRDVDEFIQRLESKPFKLTVFGKDNGNASKLVATEKEDEGENLSYEEENSGGNDSAVNLEKFGEAECRWPAKMVSSLKSNDFPRHPFVETYELMDGDEKTGLVTLSFSLHYKCQGDGIRRKTEPYVNEEGKLGVFKEIDNCLDPNDIFFVIGDPPRPQNTSVNILSNCGGRGHCSGQFNLSQFKYVQGSLVNDCNIIGGCASPGCCQVEGDMKLCKEVLEEIQAETFRSKVWKPSPVHPKDPCERIFGPMNDTYDEILSTGDDVACKAEFHTIDCVRKKRHRQKRNKQACDCQQTEPMPAQRQNQERLIKEMMKNIQQDKGRNEISYPHTCPSPELLTTAEPLHVRCCPICCEDISWVPPYGMCPKCGFKPSVKPLLAELPYDDNTTAQDILDQLKEDLKKFRKEKKINKFGACNCTPFKDCLNCQLRNLYRYRAMENSMKEELHQMAAKGNIFKQVDDFEQSADKENNADNIISDVLKRQNRKQASLENSDYKIPSIKTVMKWCKSQSDLSAKRIRSDNVASSNISFSNESSAFKTRGKSSKPECEFTTLAKNQGTGSSNTKQLRKEERCSSKRRSSKKAKYFIKDEYPGVILGHKDCVEARQKVPRYMGWLWSASIDGSKRGWRPGAVRRGTHKIMKYFLKDRECEENMCKQPYEYRAKDICMPPTVDKVMPTIRVVKKQGQYKVTVHPMHYPTKRLDPQDTRSLPIEFTIEKDPADVTKRQVKSRLKEMGFKVCSCRQPIYECECRSGMERDQLEDALETVCEELRVPIDKHTFCLSESTESESESEIDMDFSPPAALVKRPLPKKPPSNFVQTQCDPKDIQIIKNTQDIWKTSPQDVKRRTSQTCGGVSKSLPCQPPGERKSTKTVQKNGEAQKPAEIDSSKNLEMNARLSKMSKKESSKKADTPNRTKFNNTQNEMMPKQPKSAGNATKLIKQNQLEGLVQNPRSVASKKSADMTKRSSNLVQQVDKGADVLQPGQTEKNTNKTSKSHDKSVSTQLSTKELKTLKPSQPVQSAAKLDKKLSLKPTHGTNLSQSIKPRQKRLPPSAPSKIRRKIVQHVARPKNKSRESDAQAGSQQSIENQAKLNQQRKIRITRHKARKTSKPPKVLFDKRFSMSQLPMMKTATVKTNKSLTCKQVSLVRVSFKPLGCDKAAILSCPLPPPCEPRP